MSLVWMKLLVSALVWMYYGRDPLKRDIASHSNRTAPRNVSFRIKSTLDLNTTRTTIHHLDGDVDQQLRRTLGDFRSNSSVKDHTSSDKIDVVTTEINRPISQDPEHRPHLNLISRQHPATLRTPSNFIDLDHSLSKEREALIAHRDRRSLHVFHEFMIAYNKTYAIGSDEYFERFQNFLATIRRRPMLLAASANTKPTKEIPSTAIYGLNQFSDLSVEEFRQRYLTLKAPKYRATRHHSVTPKKMRRHMKKLHYPLKWDWRDSGVVTPIRNQDRCGACYAVSVVSMIESMRGIYLGRLSESLSVQQVLDCSRYSHQCGGGDPHMVLDWMNGTRRCRENESSGEVDCSWTHKHGLAFERDYPTYFVNQYCVKRINRVGLARIKDYFCNYSMDEMDILAYVYKHGPVTVGVDSTSWQDYLGGIIQHNCLENLNHAVLIVGYDISGPIPYYIVKNSWGESFGHGGYVYIRAGMQVCGIQGEVCGASI